ncbi:MAG: Hsp20/alpha crystallin family protein [Paraburkholderia tropica]|uniref:Hsp20/alpha crystallin family protein n=1 Tax=Paraburkholderia tropica TaxID=92647 RepID=UPI0031015D82
MSENTELTSHDSRTDVTSTENTRARAQLSTVSPAVDIVENSHGITLFVDLPGVPREKLDIRVQDGRMSIEAEASISAPTGLRLHHGELRHPHFSRAFTLSPDFDVSRIDAQLRDGVLRLTIPRRESAKPRRIEVNAG